MANITWRSYEPGDEVAINELYQKVTGRERTIEQFSWQWLEAPGGKGEIWLIEIEENGEKKLIGHHGVMPIRFTYQSENLLFGKTENTMVDPEYRKKILYPRFERRFLKHYESRFDATFSTIGPAAAIRQRQAMGYTSSELWKRYFWPLKVGGGLALAQERYKALRNVLPIVRAVMPRVSMSSVRLEPEELNNDEAKNSNFFKMFWNQVRTEAGIAPRRDIEDLTWRFWNNPYNEYKTLTFESCDGSKGYAIINVNDPHWYKLEDVCFSGVTADDWKELFHGISNWSRKNGALLLSFYSTEDGQVGECFKALDEGFKEGFLLSKMRAKMKGQAVTMPRRVSPESENITLSPWNITPIIFEGIR